MEYFRDMKFNQFRDGSRAALPIVLGYIPVGIAFGVLASKSGLSSLEAGAMSFIVYAGASQFIAVDMLAGSMAAAPIILTTFLVNLRHFLMSSTISTHVKQNSLLKTAAIAAQLTDESFAVAMSDTKKIEGHPGFLFGLQVTAQAAWIVSTVTGALFGPLINSTAYGIPFALPSLFICLLVLQLKTSVHVIVMMTAGVLSVSFIYILPENWNLVLAAIAASVTGMWLAAGRTDKRGSRTWMRGQIFWLLIGMALVTFLPRFIPLAIFTRWAPPERIKRMLHFMPTAIMAAIVFPVLFSSAQGKLIFEPRVLLSALPVFLLAFKTKNLWASVILGMLTYWLSGFVLPLL
jgi:4-azaleucine resistance transporter AzlC